MYNIMQTKNDAENGNNEHNIYRSLYDNNIKSLANGTFDYMRSIQTL